MYSRGVLRRLQAAALPAAAVFLLGCGGGSSGDSPAQFSRKAAGACGAVAPRLKQTSAAITALDKGTGNPLDKLPKLAALLQDLDKEFADLHAGLAKLTAPEAQKSAYARFLGDLSKLEGQTRAGVADLKPGSITGLRSFQALGAQLNATDTTLSADAAKVPGLAACNNISAG
ncbi:MAG: hypothetical protein NVSMB51_07780 [Solirubrobacteraceae bacterium]